MPAGEFSQIFGCFASGLQKLFGSYRDFAVLTVLEALCYKGFGAVDSSSLAL